MSQVIVFSQAMYNIVFTESGLPSGTSWSVTLGNMTRSSTSSTITFAVPNGTYSWSVSLPSGYKAAEQSGSVSTTQPKVSVSITASAVSTSPPPASSSATFSYTYMIII
ncbi:MAG: hypothetical protein ACP5LA_07360, partial [Thermoplasmata archaeon]